MREPEIVMLPPLRVADRMWYSIWDVIGREADTVIKGRPTLAHQRHDDSHTHKVAAKLQPPNTVLR